MQILLLDNFDSFTYMLKDYVEQCNISCCVIRNNQPYHKLLKSGKYSAILISPGPKTPYQAGNLMQILGDYVHKLPVLGICLGHQAIGAYFGALVVKSDIPRHGKVDNVKHSNHHMFAGIPEYFNATRYHSLTLQNLPHCLQPTAYAGNTLMALAHKELPVWGIQFHPESCMTPFGINIIRNFIKMVKTF